MRTEKKILIVVCIVLAFCTAGPLVFAFGQTYMELKIAKNNEAERVWVAMPETLPYSELEVAAETPEIEAGTGDFEIDTDSDFDPNALRDVIGGLITTVETAQGILEWDDKEFWRIQHNSTVFVDVSVYQEDGKGGKFTVEDGNLVFKGDIASTLQVIYEHFCRLPNSYHTKENDDNGYDSSKPILINPPEQ